MKQQSERDCHGDDVGNAVLLKDPERKDQSDMLEE